MWAKICFHHYNLQKYVSFIPMVSQSENNSNYINRKILETYISNIYSSNPYIENNKESRDAYIKKIYTFSMKQMNMILNKERM